MNPPVLTPEQITAFLERDQRVREGQRRRQADYYRRNKEGRCAYAKEYYRRKVEKEKGAQDTTTA
jgi:hypothetical protein